MKSSKSNDKVSVAKIFWGHPNHSDLQVQTSYCHTVIYFLFWLYCGCTIFLTFYSRKATKISEVAVERKY